MEAGVHPLGVVNTLANYHGRKLLDNRGDADGALVLVVFAPPDHTVFGGDLDEVVVAPTGIAVARFDGSDLSRASFQGIVR